MNNRKLNLMRDVNCQISAYSLIRGALDAEMAFTVNQVVLGAKNQ